MTPPKAAKYFEDLGMMVARLHSVQRDFFCRDVLGPDGDRSWPKIVGRRLDMVGGQFRELGREVPRDIAAAVLRLRAAVQHLSASIRPVLVHGDLYPENTVVTDGRLSALLDFEFARLWEPAADFVKLELLAFDAHAGARDSFMAGYERVRGLPDQLRARLDVVLGLELVSAMPFFLRWNDTAAVRLYEDRLSRWLSIS